MSHIGVGKPAHHSHDGAGVTAADVDDSTSTTTAGDSTTTVPESTTSTTAARKDNHGAEVSDVAHDRDLEGCEHGHAVAAVASRGKSQGKPCATTPTTVAGDDGTSAGKHDEGDDEAEHDNDGDDGHDGTPPTSVGHRGRGNGNGNGSDDDHGNSGGEHGHGQGADDHGGNDDD